MDMSAGPERLRFHLPRSEFPGGIALWADRAHHLVCGSTSTWTRMMARLYSPTPASSG
jgi:hypothetical protein